MRHTLFGSLLAAGMLVGAVMAACGGAGGGDELLTATPTATPAGPAVRATATSVSLEQYFDQVASIIDDLEERNASLEQPPAQDFESEAEEIEAIRDSFITVLPVFQDFADDLDGLDPPEEAADAHAALVAGFADLVGGLEDLIGQLVDVESGAEFSALLLDPDSRFGSGIEQLAAACLQLQSIADENDIDADLLECAA